MCSCGCQMGRVPLSGGHGLGPGQNHFQVSGHRTMQDDLFKEESFKGLKEIKRVYFSSNYACAFPWKIVPMPRLEEKPDFSMNLCSEGTQGEVVFFSQWKPHESVHSGFALFLLQRVSGQTGESGSPVWENETGWAWNIDFWFKFLSEMWIGNFPLLFVLIHLGGVLGVPDWVRESLFQVGIQPNLHPKWIVLCAVPVSLVSFWPGKGSIHLTSALTILL